MKIIFLFISIIFCNILSGQANKDILFISSGSSQNKPDHPPFVEVFLTTNNHSNGGAVLICPGGGYSHLAYEKEGVKIAKWFNSIGISAFVLNYRHDDKENNRRFHHPIPLSDALAALQKIKDNASKWSIDTNKTGIMGFSAGGHLAACAGTHYHKKYLYHDSILSKYIIRPDFMILIYPVITFSKEKYVHKGSRYHLLGNKHHKDTTLFQLLSNELHVDSTTPPTFLVHANDDQAVPVQNSILFYNALQKNNIPSEIHIFQEGGHGFGMAEWDEALNKWPGLLKQWMKNNELIK